MLCYFTVRSCRHERPRSCGLGTPGKRRDPVYCHETASMKSGPPPYADCLSFTPYRFAADSIRFHAARRSASVTPST